MRPFSFAGEKPERERRRKMHWKLTTLIENHPDQEDRLLCEHGLSVLIEGEGIRVLMDTGQSGAFYENAVNLGANLSDLDYVIFSHAHYDHTGGLLRLVREIGKPRQVLVGNGFFKICYHEKSDGRMKFIGNSFDRRMLQELGIPVKEVQEDMMDLGNGLCIHRNFLRNADFDTWNPTFFYQEEDQSCGPFGRCMDSLTYKPDRFTDEMAISIDTDRGLFVVAGCSHPGIINILTTIEQRTGKHICGLIGGTHLMEADEKRVRKTIECFKKMNLDLVGVSHCTGEKNIEILRKELGDRFLYNCTGNIIEIPY